MQNKLLLASAATLLMTGCALSPQIINIDTANSAQVDSVVEGRSALVRVRDERSSEYLGHRGGLKPQQSLLVAEPDLSIALTQKVQATLEAFGFGGNNQSEAVKLEVVIKAFEYHCNQGIVVNSCGLDLEFQLNIQNNQQIFSKPYSLSEERSVVVSPQVAYNQQWINEGIDTLWQTMFSDEQVVELLSQ